MLETDCSGNEDQPPQKLCLIAFLPDILDSKAAGRQKYIQVLHATLKLGFNCNRACASHIVADSCKASSFILACYLKCKCTSRIRFDGTWCIAR